MKRKISDRISSFFKSTKKALLVTGARQVGKTYTIREFGKAAFKSFVEINFIENKDALNIFKEVGDSNELLLRLSAITDKPLIPNETLIFFDEVQECSEIVTAIKFLVEKGDYRYILSGSLLGVELQDIRSLPVGYLDIYEMFPLDFEEFCIANGVSNRVFNALENSFQEKKAVDELVHKKMMELFMLYLMVGGMPSAVNRYLETNNLQTVTEEQLSIVNLYKKDIAKYDPSNKLYLEDIFNLIPSELNSKNKRFILKNLNENFKYSRYQNSFIWLRNAGVALPTFSVTELSSPLLLNKSSNLFKLFLSDTGLLAAMSMNGIQLKILNKEKDINFGSIYENVAAQELRAHGFDLYYYNNKKQGEIDFVIEQNGEATPIEIKSGKNYTRHPALNNVIDTINTAIVFHNGNITTAGKIIYLPIYMLMFIQNKQPAMPQLYKPDLSVLQG